jgi:lipid-binding SYLF domain-containing protein
MDKRHNRIIFALFMALAFCLSTATVLHADEKDTAKAREVVEKADITLGNFIADPDLTWFRNNVKNAKGVFIVPGLLKAGFIIGGSGGTGVLLGRNADGKWSYPAFFTMGSGTFGFAAGVEKAEIVLMVMTKKGMDSMLSSSFKLGADTSIAVGPVGAGAKAQTADILAYSRAKGLYGGISVEGSVIKTRDSLNNGYYGKAVRTVDIVIRRNVTNSHADGLIKRIAGISH